MCHLHLQSHSFTCVKKINLQPTNQLMVFFRDANNLSQRRKEKKDQKEKKKEKKNGKNFNSFHQHHLEFECWLNEGGP